MGSIEQLRAEYNSSVRNLSIEQIRVIESNGHCTSPLMHHAQACYQRLKAAEFADANPNEDFPRLQME
jgi:hypothetical protein